MLLLIFTLLTLAAIQVNGDPTCPERDGKDPVYIPDEDCTKFWQCSNGTPYLFDCPANLNFNPTLNVCDWPDQAGCDGSGEENSKNSDDSNSSESTDDNSNSEDDDNESSGEDNDGNISNNENGSGENNDGSQENNSSSGGSGETDDSKCPARDGKDSVYIPHEDCTKFWQCSNGVPILQNCPDGLYFNPELNVCDWPDQAGCNGNSNSGGNSSEDPGNDSSNSSSGDDDSSSDSDSNSDSDSSSDSDSGSQENSGEKGEGQCPAQDGQNSVYIPDEDCTQFWQCSNGVPILQNCPEGLQFNPTLNVCDWPEQAGCNGSGGDSSDSAE